MSRAGFLCAGLVCALTFGGIAAVPALGVTTRLETSAVKDPAVEVSLSRSRVSTRLGGSFDFSSTVTNTGTKPLSGLVAHLNVVGLSEDIYVDPEDWSEDRTKGVTSLGPGESASLAWSVKAVTGGEAAIYIVVLPGRNPASEGLAVSPALDVQIAERRTLNSGGVLPLALGVPALLGVATLVARARRRKLTQTPRLDSV